MKSAQDNTTVSGRVKSEDKRMINGTTDVNQLVPFRYNWAWDMYLLSCQNNWSPREFLMTDDIKGWSTAHREFQSAVMRVCGYLEAFDDLVNDSASFGAYRHISAPECRQYILRQAFEETVHAESYEYLQDKLGFTAEQSAQAWNTSPSAGVINGIKSNALNLLASPKFKTGGVESDRHFVKAVLSHFCLSQGLFMQADLLRLAHGSKTFGMNSVGSIAQNMLRDRVNHSEFGLEVINSVFMENAAILTPQFKEELSSLIAQGAEAEKSSALNRDLNVMLGVDTQGLVSQIESYANSIAKNLRLNEVYPGSKSTLSWVNQYIEKSQATHKNPVATGSLTW